MLGLREGLMGCWVGDMVGVAVGFTVGLDVAMLGLTEGLMGCWVGDMVGFTVGFTDGGEVAGLKDGGLLVFGPVHPDISPTDMIDDIIPDPKLKKSVLPLGIPVDGHALFAICSNCITV